MLEPIKYHVERRGSYFILWWIENGRRKEMDFDYELEAWDWVAKLQAK